MTPKTRTLLAALAVTMSASLMLAPLPASAEKLAETSPSFGGTDASRLQKDMLKKLTTYSRRRFSRPIRATGTASRQFAANRISVQLKVVGHGQDVGAAVNDLNSQKAEILKIAEAVNAAPVDSGVTGLDVQRSRSSRREQTAGPDPRAYSGKMQLTLTLNAGDDPLSVIATIANGRVEGISRTTFAVADREKKLNALKKMALANARADAEERAAEMGAKVGKLMNVEYRDRSNRRSYNTAQTQLKMQATATFERLPGVDQ